MELSALFEKLKLDHLEAQLDTVCEQAAKREHDYKTFLTSALEAEWKGRFQRTVESRLRQARFPWSSPKSVDTCTLSRKESTDGRNARGVPRGVQAPDGRTGPSGPDAVPTGP